MSPRIRVYDNWAPLWITDFNTNLNVSTRLIISLKSKGQKKGE